MEVAELMVTNHFKEEKGFKIARITSSEMTSFQDYKEDQIQTLPFNFLSKREITRSVTSARQCLN